MGSNLYKERILQHYKNPENNGEIQNADYQAAGENPNCGDTIHVFINTNPQNQITNIKFTVEGCAISQASASMVTEELHGKQLEQIHELSHDQIIDILGVEITPMRIKCAVLIQKVAEQAVQQKHEKSEE